MAPPLAGSTLDGRRQERCYSQQEDHHQQDESSSGEFFLLTSPTGVTNSVPRRPNRKRCGKKHTTRPLQNNPNLTNSSHRSSSSGCSIADSLASGSGGGNNANNSNSGAAGSNTMLAAESFQRAFESFSEPMPENSGAAAAAGHANNGQSSPFMCGNIPALSGGGTAGSASGPSAVGTDVASNQRLVCTSAVQTWTPVAKKAAGKARQGMTEFALIAAEVYRQECKSDHRGDDADFFMEQTSDMQTDQHSLMENHSLQSGEQRDPKDGSGNGAGSKSSRLSRNRGSPSDLNHKLEKECFRAVKNSPAPVVTPATTATTRSSHSESPRLTPPPAVERQHRQIETRTFRPTKYLPYGHDDLPDKDIPREVDMVAPIASPDKVDDDDELRSARMQLFQNDASNEPETRLARALDDLNRQDVFIQSLRRQMQITQETLDTTTQELEQAKATAQEKQFKATEIRARAVQEKKRLEDLYVQEVEQGKKLQEKVSQLQADVSTLKVSLRNARSSAQTSAADSSARGIFPGPKDGPVTSAVSAKAQNAQLISLKAEIVDLRSQLAETHAANIDDCSTLHNVAEVEELRNKLRKTEDELKSLRQTNRENREELEQLVAAQNEQQQKLQSTETSFQDTKERLEENLMIAMKSADDVRAELVKTKANLQRLERERSRARLQSSPDVGRLRTDLTKAREESASLKQELSNVRSRFKADRQEWSEEMEQLREKLQRTNQETLSRSADRLREQRRLHDEVSRNVSEIKSLKDMLNTKNEELDAKAMRLVELEHMVKDLRQRAEDGVASSDGTLAKMQQQLREMQAREITVVSELRLQKSLLDEARRNPSDPDGQVFLANLSEDHIVQLREELEKLQSSKAPGKSEQAGGQKDVNTSLREEIAKLKLSLAASSPRPSPQSQSPSKTEAHLVAMEQAFMNEIAALKAKLSDSQSKVREESFRAQEERRIKREAEADRLAEFERLRVEKDQALDAKRTLELEVSDLRRRLAQLSDIQSPLSSIEGISTTAETSKKDLSTIPNGNVKRLRNELARARERLAAARQSRSSPTPRAVPSSTDGEVASTNSQAPRESMSNESSGSSWEPPSAIASTPSSQLVPLARNVSLLDVRSSEKASLDELTRQLEASRKRLQTADQRLNGLVNEGGSLLTIVRKYPEDSTFDGSIDEVVNTLDGGIEVSHRRFADI